MSNIIEKLGIEEIEQYQENGMYYCLAHEVRELEQQRNDMLEALIEIVQSYISLLKQHHGSDKTTEEIEDLFKPQIRTIEKTADMSWSKIKELS